MKFTARAVTILMAALAVGCATVNKQVPIILLDPEVDGLTVTVNGATISDPDGPFLWNWGDGTVDTSWFPNTHTYTEPGFYHVIVEVCRDGKPVTEDLYLKLVE
jgi:hypothetical protein